MAGVTVTYLHGKGVIPDSYIPWKPLNILSGIGPFTKLKIKGMGDETSACQRALTEAGIKFQSLPDRQSGQCVLRNQVGLVQSRYPYSAPVSATCPMIASLAIWEKYVLAPLAQQYFGSDIAKVHHYGVFSCRKIRGESNRWSQHAAANAIDISGFTLRSGEYISVKNDWPRTETQQSKFLKAVRTQSCGLFTTVLSPDYNSLHNDHFHFDLGRYSICR